MQHTDTNALVLYYAKNIFKMGLALAVIITSMQTQKSQKGHLSRPFIPACCAFRPCTHLSG